MKKIFPVIATLLAVAALILEARAGMNRFFSALILLVLLFVQIEISRRRLWAIAVPLPLLVLAFLIADRMFLHNDDLLFFGSNTGSYAWYFVGAGIANVWLVIHQDRKDKSLRTRADGLR